MDWHDVYSFLEKHYPTIAGVMLAFLMAVARTKQQTGQINWSESVMCGLFSMAIGSSLGLLGLPETANLLISGAVGFWGTQKVSSWISGKIGIK